MNYKRAFQCKKCPQSNSEDGCPMWWEFMMEEASSGRQEMKKMCGYQALPIFLLETVKASNRPAAVLEDARNKMLEALLKKNGSLFEPTDPNTLLDSPDA